MKASKISFKFNQKEYRRKLAPQLQPLSFIIGSLEEHPIPPFIKQCGIFLDDLIKKDVKGQFYDWRSYERDNTRYTELIKNPIDFKTIKEKLFDYPNIDAFKADVDLIWHNCVQYYGTNSNIGLYAMTLRGIFNEKWNLYTSINRDDALNVVKLKNEIRSISQQLDEKSNHELFKFPGHDIPPLRKQKPKTSSEKTKEVYRPPEELSKKPLSTQEKEELAKRIDYLIPALLGEVIDILEREMKLNLSTENTIPFSSIETPVLRKIEAYVKEAERKEKQVKRLYQLKPMPQDKQIEKLMQECKKFEELLSTKKVNAGSEFSSDIDTDNSEDSDSTEVSTSDSSES